MSFVVRKTTIKLGMLGVCQRCSGGNAVPELFDEYQALLDAETIDTE